MIFTIVSSTGKARIVDRVRKRDMWASFIGARINFADMAATR